jgi:hypothetical protein
LGRPLSQCLGPRRLDPWAEEFARRQALAPAWHAENAEAAEQGGDWFAASFHRRWLTRLRPGEPLERVLLARACARLGRLREALGLCDRLLAERPGLAPAYLERARLHFLAGQQAAEDADTLAGVALAANSRTGWPDFAAQSAEAGEGAAARGDWPGAR